MTEAGGPSERPHAMDGAAMVLAYHEATKHHPHRYARSAGYLDWANQPDPFRRYPGAPLHRLPLHAIDDTPPYEDLYSRAQVPARAVNTQSIGLFFECSLALSAWKEFRGERWPLRCNPSSGNLHPTEGYLVAGPIEGLTASPGVYHYAPKEHALEERCAFDSNTWGTLAAAFPRGTFFVGLTSIHWREAWKYGERAYRYCQHDVGHALAALRLAAAMLGWRARMLDALPDALLAALLGVDRDDGYHEAEREAPDLLLAVMPREDGFAATLPSEPVTQIAQAAWYGTPNRLSKNHADWSIIDRVYQACAKYETPPESHRAGVNEAVPPVAPCGLSALRIIQQRRSAVAMDGKTCVPQHTFYHMLARVVPSLCSIPWDATASPPHVHLALFVHCVDGIPPGLYALGRDASALEPLRDAMRADFVWEKPEGCPDGLDLCLLVKGDCREAAATLSCGQDIAGDGVFSLGMFAEFEPVIREQGPHVYRQLFWEAGMIGQVLYLEAEAAGVRATGIGCFFDDPVHEVFGLQERRCQSLYHFTIGGPVDDPRLTTLPPYSR